MTYFWRHLQIRKNVVLDRYRVFGENGEILCRFITKKMEKNIVARFLTCHSYSISLSSNNVSIRILRLGKFFRGGILCGFIPKKMEKNSVVPFQAFHSYSVSELYIHTTVRKVFLVKFQSRSIVYNLLSKRINWSPSLSRQLASQYLTKEFAKVFLSNLANFRYSPTIQCWVKRGIGQDEYQTNMHRKRQRSVLFKSLSSYRQTQVRHIAQEKKTKDVNCASDCFFVTP